MKMNFNGDPPPQFVLTVPAGYDNHLAYRSGARLTLGVLTELIHNAQYMVVLAAPYISQDAGIGGPALTTACRVALERGVHLAILSTGIGLQSLRIWRDSTPVHFRENVEFFRPATNLATPEYLGSHAKFCLCDNTAVYIGSANLTNLGLSGHLEMGVLSYGSLARQVADFWNFSVDSGVFVPVE